jgi:hypothetical protein
VGIGKVAAATILKRSVRSRRRQSERLTLGAYGVLIFPIYSKLAQHGNQKRMPYLALNIPKFFLELSQLCRHPNLNKCSIKILGTDSQFEFLVNF